MKWTPTLVIIFIEVDFLWFIYEINESISKPLNTVMVDFLSFQFSYRESGSI